MNVLLIFDMHDLNGALLLKVSILFVRLFPLVPAAVITPLTTIYASFTSIHFLVTNFDTDESFNDLDILYFPFYNTCLNSFLIFLVFSLVE